MKECQENCVNLLGRVKRTEEAFGALNKCESMFKREKGPTRLVARPVVGEQVFTVQVLTTVG